MLREKFKEDLVSAMREKNKIKTGTMRLIMAALKDRDIAVRSKGNMDGIAEDEILSMLQTMIKQRRDSIALYKQGGRDELAEKETSEINIIEAFLPKQMDQDEMKAVIEQAIEKEEASGLKDMGRVMGFLKEEYNGQMDFASASGIVKEKLAG